MPVPDPDRSDDRTDPAAGQSDRDRHFGERGGRRQHHRRTEAPAPGSDELVYLSGRVPRALRDELHIRAIHEGRPLVDLLREAIRQYLDQGHSGRANR